MRRIVDIVSDILGFVFFTSVAYILFKHDLPTWGALLSLFALMCWDKLKRDFKGDTDKH